MSGKNLLESQEAPFFERVSLSLRNVVTFRKKTEANKRTNIQENGIASSLRTALAEQHHKSRAAAWNPGDGK
jgi:hypothetical protein